ncbi:hypothetical protein Tco_1517910 [Tanacetum coccineum]
MGLRSKYVNKTVDPTVTLTEDEKLLGRSIFSTQEEEEETMNIQSLAPGMELDTQVIDAYVSILNYEEKFKMMNMKRRQAVIIDNSDSDATYEGKYKDNVNFVRQVFGRHLMMYENRNAGKILKLAKKATVLKIKWKTTKEKIDCGGYMIMHMELYEGSTIAQWKTSLLPENDKNHQMQMDNLRSRIAAKLLLHEVNNHRMKMSDYAKKMTEAG